MSRIGLGDHFHRVRVESTPNIASNIPFSQHAVTRATRKTMPETLRAAAVKTRHCCRSISACARNVSYVFNYSAKGKNMRRLPHMKANRTRRNNDEMKFRESTVSVNPSLKTFHSVGQGQGWGGEGKGNALRRRRIRCRESNQMESTLRPPPNDIRRGSPPPRSENNCPEMRACCRFSFPLPRNGRPKLSESLQRTLRSHRRVNASKRAMGGEGARAIEIAASQRSFAASREVPSRNLPPFSAFPAERGLPRRGGRGPAAGARDDIRQFR
jgi:hypothetical protein